MPAEQRRVDNRHLVPGLVAGLVRNALRDPPAIRERLLKPLWIEVKRFAAPSVESVRTVDIAGLSQIVVKGVATRPDSLVLCALCRLLGCRTVFEIGTFHGEMAWLLAHNDPGLQVYTLDLPDADSATRSAFELTDPEYFGGWDRGVRFRGTPEGERITQLLGDSASFDYSPFAGAMDLVFIDASHNYASIRSDTEAAFGMLSSRGAVVWDDYTHYPGIYAYVNELSGTLDRPIMHLLGTRLALYLRGELATASFGVSPAGVLQRKAELGTSH